MKEMKFLLSVDVLSDDSFKNILEKYPQQKKYLTSIQEEMIELKKKKDLNYVILYSVKDDVSDFYFFWH